MKRRANSKKKNTTTNKNNKNGNNSFTRIVYKPRHGVRLTCEVCNWKFRGGGYTTKKEALTKEKALKKMHDKHHKENLIKNGGGYLEHTDSSKTLQIQRDFHAAEITHNFLEYNTRQTTTSTSYIDVPNTTITSALTANQDHLVIATAQFDAATTSGDEYVRLVYGTTPTVIADSEAIMDPPVDPVTMVQRMPYFWWGIVNPGATTSDLKMQYMMGSSGNTAGIDLISISVIKLTPDLTANTDYKHQLVTANTTISATTSLPGDASSDTATNNALITLTPSVASHKWLILSKARYTATATTTGAQSRISHSGGASTNEPTMQKEGEDVAVEAIMLSGLRTDTLSGVSQTYEEISKGVNTGAGTEGVSSTRTHSGIFMLDLDRAFQTVATNQEDTPFEDITSTTDYAHLVHTLTFTPTTAGNVLILGYVTGDYGGSGSSTSYYKMRMQIDNADPEANTTTTKAYAIAQYDTADRLPLLYATKENLTAASHTADLDGSVHTAASAGEGTYTRNLTAISMEMAGAALKQVVTENTGVTESIVRVMGTARIKLPTTESIGVTESVIKILGSGTDLIVSTNLEVRLSGGTPNIDPDASLGGARSTVNATKDYDPDDFKNADYVTDASRSKSGVVFSRLLDDVLKAEASIGDTEYRCFYLLNTHGSLTMQDLKLWISVNTPATADEVQVGLGTSAINGVEQTVANENTAPSSVSFSLAANEAAALSVGNIPPGQHKAIWIKRIVTADPTTPAYYNNTYSLLAKLNSDHA